MNKPNLLDSPIPAPLLTEERTEEIVEQIIVGASALCNACVEQGINVLDTHTLLSHHFLSKLTLDVISPEECRLMLAESLASKTVAHMKEKIGIIPESK